MAIQRFKGLPRHPAGEEFDAFRNPSYHATFGDGLIGESGPDGFAVAVSGSKRTVQPFLAKLTAITAISAAAGRWVYDFTEVAMTGTFSGTTLTGVSADTLT